MKTAIHAQNAASRKFNPFILKDFLIRTEEGDVIVDRARLLLSKDDERLFYVVLNKDYGWDYRYHAKITIYFEEKDGKVFGGTYEPSIGRRSNRIIAVARDAAKEYNYNLYAYEPDALASIINRIHKS